jgi:hypothetical protein
MLGQTGRPRKPGGSAALDEVFSWRRRAGGGAWLSGQSRPARDVPLRPIRASVGCVAKAAAARLPKGPFF